LSALEARALFILKDIGTKLLSIDEGPPFARGQSTRGASRAQFVEDGVTGRIIDLLRRAAVDALGHKSKSVGIDQLLIAGAHLPAIINQGGEFPI